VALATSTNTLSSTTKEFEEMHTKQVSAWKEEKEDLASHLRVSETGLSALNKEKNELCDELNHKDKELAAAHNEISQAKINHTEMLSRVNMLMDRLDEKDSALANATSSFSSVTKEHEDMQTKQLSAWEEEKEELASRLHESEASLKEMTSRNRQVEMEHEDKERALAAANNEISQAKISQVEMLSRFNSLMDRLDEKDTALGTATSSLSSAKKEYKELQTKQLSAWEEVKEDLTSRLHDSEAKLCQVLPPQPVDATDHDAVKLSQIQELISEEKKEVLDHQAGLGKTPKENHCEKENSSLSPLSNPKSTLQRLAALSMKQSRKVPISPNVAALSPRNYRQRSPSPFKVNVPPMNDFSSKHRIALDSPMKQRHAPVDPE